MLKVINLSWFLQFALYPLDRKSYVGQIRTPVTRFARTGHAHQCTL